MADRPRLLILGGTAEALALAEAAAGRFDIVYSLAGRTRAPSLPANATVRTGGFGGADALAGWLAENRIAAVVDATHPFADAIAANAAAACAAGDTPRLKLLRPAWEKQPGDIWHDVPDIGTAARRLPGLGRRAFLSLGRMELAAFANLEGLSFLVRTVDPLDPPPLTNATCITGRGPFTLANETALLTEHAVDVVVSKNAGGDATYAKIEAAQALSIPVVMIGRPETPAGKIVETAEAALDWMVGL